MANEIHIHVVETMKNQVKDRVEFLISKLQSHFLWHYVMEVFGVVHLQYWMMVDYEESLMRQFNLIKAQYRYPKKIGCNQNSILNVLSFMFLHLYMSFFKLKLKCHVALAMGFPYIVNPMIQLWRPLASS
jgi:hypothetical protein